MTTFNIYQVNLDRDEKGIAFSGYSRLEKHNIEVQFYVYDLVYSAKMNFDNLEQIFEVFNMARPDDYKGRSLSVSDVVEIVDSDTMGKGLYYVDDIGFTQISATTFFKEKKTYDADKINELLEGMLNEMGNLDPRASTGKAWRNGVIDAVRHIQEQLNEM